jgi:hypothetical protein
LPINGFNFLSAGFDETFPFQVVGGFGDAGAAHAQHMGEELMRQEQFIRVKTVTGLKQPATQAFFYSMKAVASNILRDLRDIGLRVFQHHVPQRLIGVELLEQMLCLHSYRFAGNLDDVLGLRRFAPAHEGVDPYHLAAADHSSLSRAAVVHRDGDRDQAGEREVDIFNSFAGLVEHLTV